MAKYTCCYSGLEITTTHFPLYLSARSAHAACHPIFHADQRTLLGYARKWSAGELTSIDSYLLYTALLRSTDLVLFRTAAKYIPQEQITEPNGTTHTPLGSAHIVSQNMERLMIAIARINAIGNPSVRYPGVVITEENASLYTSKHWIDNWNAIWQDYQDGSKKQALRAQIALRESALHRLIKSPHRRIESYSKSLADWASDAAGFPTFMVTLESAGTDGATKEEQIVLADYWKRIIQQAAAKEYHKINTTDLKELETHCAERIEYSIDAGENAGGSIQSFLLFKLFEETKNYFRALLRTSNVPSAISAKSRIAASWTFAEIESEEDEEDSDYIPGLAEIVASTPEAKPEPHMFATKLDYIKAKIKWDVANNARARVAAPANASADNGLGF